MGFTNYISTMWVRRGNAVFMVSARILDAAGSLDPARTGEATRALGRSVATALR